MKVFEDRHFRIEENVLVDNRKPAIIKEIITANSQYLVELEDSTTEVVSLDQIED